MMIMRQVGKGVIGTVPTVACGSIVPVLYGIRTCVPCTR